MMAFITLILTIGLYMLLGFAAILYHRGTVRPRLSRAKEQGQAGPAVKTSLSDVR